MRPNELVLRCFAERDEGVWVAYCLDLSLVAQGDSLEEVRGKLDAQVREYVHDALAGQDRRFAASLLSRKAPLSTYMRYYRVKALIAIARKLHAVKKPQAKPFKEVLPLAPQLC